jgi:hypothetical protein
MHRPETHLRYAAERHADLLREARRRELAASMKGSGRGVRRSLVFARFWSKRKQAAAVPAGEAAPAGEPIA